ncbi:transcriptional regulator of RNA polII, SAGA, subunit-domain-containing protein [Syncephalis pseudoplumigaleata]|uniref:Transcriptional regulator of RNA polII, SAGA, subunit-domain-containing protein n=1 Tax=Syncephalis pseudoplumigaleata TaxID=1712513 RepID=A0A4P9YY64_9FUNG|nr:transcriptional regulator of RNA polII, SAGA, subunit-domain-containing protein [Syncephalis pseudoplumigaleata]|eukprot:RKP24888.1 transcriptional regulator of RNA polII, SAGA, subunit-domain-containing protein [Syncephalis pseudoplumigaleata]
MAPDGRRDTLAFKEKLNQVLGTNAVHYWSALKEFLTGRLNRDEFDHWATLYLPADQIYLHNEFLLSTLFNALLETPPNDAGKGLKRKFGETDGDAGKTAAGEDGAKTPADAKSERPAKRKETPAERKHRELKQAVRALSKSERDRIRSLLKKQSNASSMPAPLPAAPPRISFPPPLVKLAQDPETLPAFATEYMRTLQAPFSSDAKGIPSGDALLDRMHAVAMEQGIHGIQQDAVRLMFSALEASIMHMKTIIEQCIIKLRANRLFGIRTHGASGELDGKGQELAAASITAADGIVHMEDEAGEEGHGAAGVDASDKDKPAVADEKRPAGRRHPRMSTTIQPRDLLFMARVSPHIMVESPLNIERLNSVVLSNTRLEHELSQQRAKQLTSAIDREYGGDDDDDGGGEDDAMETETEEHATLDEFLDSVLGIQYA